MREITPENVKAALENPDMYSHRCQQHLIHLKNIDGNILVVLSEIYGTRKAKVICANWLQISESATTVKM